MKKWGLLALIFVSFGTFIWFKKYGESPVQKRTRFLMDTICTIQVPGDNKALKAIDKALDRIEEIDKKFNVLNPKSQIYAFNNSGSPISDEEIISLIKVALKTSKDTDGAFDITVYPLVKVWGFYGELPASPEVPSKKEIEKCIRETGYQNIAIKDGRLIKLRKSAKIDLGGIAKGYAVGEAVKVLKSEGITSALIDCGGNIYALGKLRSKPWKIGIRDPRGEGVIGVVEISDLAIATSGDYERYFEKDGVRYHHILNPKTGYPAQGLISVSVITSDPTVGDALSTAFFVMGKEKALALMDKTKEAETVMVTPDCEISFSSGLKENLEVIRRAK